MSESGLYAPAYAALALKQAEGSIEEAVFCCGLIVRL